MVFYSEFLAQEFLADEILHYLPYPVLGKALHILLWGIFQLCAHQQYA